MEQEQNENEKQIQNQEDGQNHESESENFIKGLFCGILLVLICAAGTLILCQMEDCKDSKRNHSRCNVRKAGSGSQSGEA